MSDFLDWLLDNLEGAVAVLGGAGAVIAIGVRRLRAALRARRDCEREELLDAVRGVAARVDESERRNERRHGDVSDRLDGFDRRFSTLSDQVSYIEGHLRIRNGRHRREAAVD